MLEGREYKETPVGRIPKEWKESRKVERVQRLMARFKDI
jgi:hypothetical protein